MSKEEKAKKDFAAFKAAMEELKKWKIPPEKEGEDFVPKPPPDHPRHGRRITIIIDDGPPYEWENE